MPQLNVGDIVGVYYTDEFEYILEVETKKIRGSDAYSGVVKDIFGIVNGHRGQILDKAAIREKLIGTEIDFDSSQIRPVKR
jgi:hypothetical protein